MKKYEISVCVLTYQPDYQELLVTIISVLKQTGIQMEIIISDDGSSNNFFSELVTLFQTMAFTDYKLVTHEKNQGTVKNCLDAVQKAEGKYIKLISPGDYLRREDTLRTTIDFMNANHLLACFSDLIYYKKNDPHEIVCSRSMPQEVTVYNDMNLKLQKMYYFILSDKVCGASWITEKDLLYKYLCRIDNKVIYSEDSIYRLMVCDGIPLGHQPLSSVYYQVGTGISTSGSEKWRERLYRDDEAMNELLIDMLKQKKKNKRMRLYLSIEKEHNRSKTNFAKGILYPWSVILWVRMKRRPRFTENETNFEFIDACFREAQQLMCSEI